MSLHAQISPEAQAKLNVQKRNSTISSIIIALLFCALLVTILFYIALSPLFKNTDEMITYSSKPNNEERILKPEMSNEVEKKPSSPSSSMAKVIAANTPSATAVPVPDQVMTEPSLDFGDGDDFGDGWGSGSGGSGAGGAGTGFGIPASMKKRCSAKDRIERLVKGGGKEEYEEQVVNALKWLQKTQQADGSWNAQSKPVAMTGLALLAYLGHCETPLSPEFGETVQAAIVYLIANGKKNGGGLATSTANKQWCYEHPIATYALAEAYTLCKEFKIAIPGLKETVLAAGNLIIGNQNDNGGWAYAYETSGGHTDTSVVCWQLQALKACKTTKLEFNGLEKSAKRGIEYLESCTAKDGTVGYKSPGGRTTMTPGGSLCYQQWGKGKRSLTRKGIKWMGKNNDFDYKVHGNLYMHYYASQAMINEGGATWSKYNKKTMVNLAENQSPDGSWPVPGKAGHGMSSDHYATCLATLMMEVYYRFLPSSE
ncbi:MAG: hypothetical protein ACI9E1_001867 [Cryomorphaceae bacterium]|jgi:hypothetical protein